jgi:hypothetical protein
MLPPGQRVTNTWTGQGGVVVKVRDDAYERKQREVDSTHPHYYHVEYDDGNFDTYVNENALFVDNAMKR